MLCTTVQVDPNAPVNPLGYTGQYQDPATSLLDLRARQYNPALGAFTSTDPTPTGPTSPYDSAYDYAGDDPINTNDPAGTMHGSPGEPFNHSTLDTVCSFDPGYCGSGVKVNWIQLAESVSRGSGTVAEIAGGACVFTAGVGCAVASVAAAIHLTASSAVAIASPTTEHIKSAVVDAALTGGGVGLARVIPKNGADVIGYLVGEAGAHAQPVVVDLVPRRKKHHGH